MKPTESTSGRAYAVPLIAVLIYSIITYVIFREVDSLELVSTSFIIGMPIAIGALVILFAPEQYRTRASYGIFMPWLPLFGLCAAAVVAGWEPVICIIMALPILLPTCSLGGLALVKFNRYRADRMSMLCIIALLPFLIAPIENLFPTTHEIISVESSIHIDADAEAVWDQIIAVPEIQPDERPFSYLDLAGFPRPIEAQLSRESLGGMRRASYDNGLILWEPVTVWEPYKRYTFDVQVDENAPQPFTEIGGAHFDVLEVGFTLEPAADGGIKLRLHTDYRLSTRFNFYVQTWTDFLMRDLQGTILHIIKGRAEK